MNEEDLLKLHYALPLPLNRFETILQQERSITEIYQLSPTQLARLLKIPLPQAANTLTRLKQMIPFSLRQLYEQENIIPISYSNHRYPEQLLHLIDPPTIIYAMGDTSLLASSSIIAIIGSRRASSYSEQALQYIVPPLIEQQAIIVSGLAKGADTMAHRAAIQLGGRTIAVLGHGFHHCYPLENKQLATTIAKHHLLLTEYPPYIPPAKWTFPMRNRIISGLSESIIITEAAEKSGTMSTVEHALDHGKDVYAVPGAITSPLSIGPNRLIAEGAKPIWHGFQVDIVPKGSVIK